LFSRGSYGETGDKDHFNTTYWAAISESNKAPIIRREAVGASSSDHKDIYFKRKTNPSKFNAWENLVVKWTVDSTNELNKDFDIYSSLKDAMLD
jgi:hypothetical protein